MNTALSATVISYHLDMLLHGRKNMVGLISQYNPQQLNLIPSGYKNNLIWNFGHIIVSQQRLCYKNSGLESVVSSDLMEQFKKGTVPEGEVEQAQIDILKTLAIDTAKQFKKDYLSGIFKDYHGYRTSYGVEINSIEDAIVFNNTHEGIHLGYLLAMRKLI